MRNEPRAGERHAQALGLPRLFAAIIGVLAAAGCPRAR